MEVYCEMVREFDFNNLEDVIGIIFSGGPSSVYLENSPTIDKKYLI